MASHDPHEIFADRARSWVRDHVVGRGLCPFARAPLEQGRVRFAVSDAREPEALALDLARELQRIVRARPEVHETTLLIHPFVLGAFDEYNAFLDDADGVLELLELRGVIQIASFHPDYRFEGDDPEAAEHYTNRSPDPMLHLLREESVARAVAEHGEPAEIPRHNIGLLRRLGRAQLAAELEALRRR